MNGKALWVVLEAKSGKEAEVEKFLQAGQGLVEAEPKTVSWFAIKIGPSTYGIFDTFADDSGGSMTASTSFTTTVICSGLIIPTLPTRRLLASRISTPTIASMLTWFGSCRMTASI